MTSLIRASADRPGDDPIFAANAEATRRAQTGEDVLNATIGALMNDQGRLAIMPTVLESFARASGERAAAYAPISGPPVFLTAVIEDVFRTGPLAPHAAAVATAGGTGAIHHAITNFLEPGQAALTTSYFWGPYGNICDHTGRRIDTFPMFGAAGEFDVRALDSALARHVREQGRALLILNSPCHNPTGYSLSARDWDDLVESVSAHAARAPVTLLIDFAYSKFAPPGTFRWPEQLERLAGRAGLLFAWTASKSFAQYGARVGALITVEPDAAQRARVTNALSYACRGTWSNCNHLGMLAITELLTDPELRKCANDEREALRRLLFERVQAFNALAPRAGLCTPRFDGGFFVAVFTRDPRATSERMKELGVFIVPMQGAVRVGLCSTPVAHVPRLVEALSEGVLAAGGARA
jgi:aromatic-amino-acid transaminase